MALLWFWAQHSQRGVHPLDRPFLGRSDVLSLSAAEVRAAPGVVESQRHQLHDGLFPSPFFGRIESAAVYILFGNPGVSAQDYEDEDAQVNPGYVQACVDNLRGTSEGFLPLLQVARGTGAQKYWLSTFRRLIWELSVELAIPPESAQGWVARNVAVIEKGGYHSRRFSNAVFEHLPSTKAANEFVRCTVVPRMKEDRCIVVSWRQADWWNVPEHPNHLVRPSRLAQQRYLLSDERENLRRYLIDAWTLRHSGARRGPVS